MIEILVEIIVIAFLIGFALFIFCAVRGGVPESLKGILPKGFVDAFGGSAAKRSPRTTSSQEKPAQAATREASRQQDDWKTSLEGRLKALEQAHTELRSTVGQLASEQEDMKRQLAVAAKPVVAPPAPTKSAEPVRPRVAEKPQPTYPYVRYAQLATSRQPVGFADDDLSTVADRCAFLIRVRTADTATYELTTNVEAVRRVLLSLNFYDHLLDVDNQTHGELQHARMTACGRLRREGSVWVITEKLKLIIS